MLLDFEKPIAELEAKLVDMKQLAQDNNVDVASAVKSLEEKIKSLKKETYTNLTRWQRVQLSRHPDRSWRSICNGNRSSERQKHQTKAIEKLWYGQSGRI